MPKKKRRGDRGMAPATLQALALVDAGKMNPHAASKAAGISYVTIWRALKRRRERAQLEPAQDVTGCGAGNAQHAAQECAGIDAGSAQGIAQGPAASLAQDPQDVDQEGEE